VSPGPQNAERSRQGRRDAEETAVSPRTLNRLRPRGRVEALRAEPRDSLYASVGWVSARGRFA
jgi:hypothetical protein